MSSLGLSIISVSLSYIRYLNELLSIWYLHVFYFWDLNALLVIIPYIAHPSTLIHHSLSPFPALGLCDEKLFPYKGQRRDLRQPVGDRRATDSEGNPVKTIPVSQSEVPQRTS